MNEPNCKTSREHCMFLLIKGLIFMAHFSIDSKELLEFITMLENVFKHWVKLLWIGPTPLEKSMSYITGSLLWWCIFFLCIIFNYSYFCGICIWCQIFWCNELAVLNIICKGDKWSTIWILRGWRSLKPLLETGYLKCRCATQSVICDKKCIWNCDMKTVLLSFDSFRQWIYMWIHHLYSQTLISTNEF